jgi:aldehyde:ferredoxin oxidoreductase
MDIDKTGLKKIVNRSRNLHRALNNMRGLRRVEELPPEDHWKHRFPELEEALMMHYYQFKGWTADGIPTPERLKDLDLGYVAEDLIKRGILSDGQDQKKGEDHQNRC